DRRRAHSHRDAGPARLTLPPRRPDRRSRPGSPSRGDRRQFAADPALFPSRHARRLLCQLRLERAAGDRRPPSQSRYALDREWRSRPDALDAAHFDLEQRARAGLPDRAQDRRRLSVHRRADRRQCRPARLAGRELGTNQTMRTSSHLFAGAKEITLLNRYTDQLGTDIGRAIDWGWFGFIMTWIFKLLIWLFSVLGNFGFAIVCLTIIVRLFLFPLAQKQFSSMAKMKVLQPKVKALQARYADDKQRQQQ